MPTFKYEALDSKGNVQKNVIEALTQSDAAVKIRKNGYFPLKLTQTAQARQSKRQNKEPTKRKNFNTKVKAKVLTEFARELSTLQDAGLPILASLQSLIEQERNNRFRGVLTSVADDIESGATLSEAMGKYPGCFDRLFVGMVEAGEKGGVLESILTRVAEFMEKAERLRGKVKGAMIYPAAVLITAFTILLLLMTFIVPRFEMVLREMTGEKLNVLTRTVMGIASWIAADFGWAILTGIPIAAIFMYRFARRFQAGRVITDAVILKLPVIGELTGSICTARWTRTLGTLLGAGVPILDAIEDTSRTTGNEIFSKVLRHTADSIRQGDNFANPLRKSKLIPCSALKMLSVGEESGDLDKMLLKVADKYDYRVETKVNALVSVMEPAVIILMGVIVFFIVLSLLLPIFDIYRDPGGNI